MPPGKRPLPRITVTRDPVLGNRYTRYDQGRRAREIEEGDVRSAVGDRELARLKASVAKPRPTPARTPTPPATPAAQPARRDALKDGAEYLRDPAAARRRREEEAGLAEGGRVRAAGKKCSCGKKTCKMCGKK